MGATVSIGAASIGDPSFQTEFTQQNVTNLIISPGDGLFIARLILFQHLRKGQ
ncbi:hypothetical protein F4802DRAFT_564068 [Xylaria palmicola]|nr:hypothetical protein F4802DRAFT_564068 [Xylaria palmicola]